jgi:matrix metalloproteinase-14 (membrane-inserted)
VRPRTSVSLAAVVLAFVTVLSDDSRAYEWNKFRWNQTPVPYYVNPANLDLPTNVIAPALKVGADSWALQSAAAFAFTYAGTSTQTTNTNDGINLVLFRNASMGSAIATTYSWFTNNSLLIDTDIVFWDGGFQFFTGTTGCSNGFYIEDIATHEFGHALGLGHSEFSNATMYPSTSYCNAANRSLDADDVAGVEQIYGRRATTPPVPPAPTGLRFIRP